jgi:hypothetical protein
MRITDEAIEAFRVLWEEQYGMAISVDEAREHADRLLKLLVAVYVPRRNRRRW